jgi:hypothetical protein
VIHHCAAATYLGVEREVAERLNVEGRARGDRAGSGRHGPSSAWFTGRAALVSGGRTGWVREDELIAPAALPERGGGDALPGRGAGAPGDGSGLPVTILRPAIGVGDSKTGRDRSLRGPYLLVLLMLSSPVDLRVPLPGRGEAMAEPGAHRLRGRRRLHHRERHAIAMGRTFHLVDPEPVTAREVFERIAEAAGRPCRGGSCRPTLATALLQRALASSGSRRSPRTFLEQLATDVSYDARNARENPGAPRDPLPALLRPTSR